MTSSATVCAPSDLVGDQTPRLYSVPSYESSLGREAIELAAYAGQDLDPWQRLVVTDSLGRGATRRWSAPEVCVILSRQNGKGGVIETRQLAGIYLLDEPLIVYTAHEFKTAQEAFRRLMNLVDSRSDLSKRVLRVVRSTNEMGIELRGGARCRFVARSGRAGRGFTGDCVILDEAMFLGDEQMEALVPTMSARPASQMFYFGSAGLEVSVQQGRLRRRGLARDPDLAFFEWSARAKILGDEIDDAHDDPAAWTRANPALGYRITVGAIERELRALSAEGFARERLGIGTYPPEDGEGWDVISRAAWDAVADPAGALDDPVAFAVDVTPERSFASVAAAGQRGDSLHQVEIVAHQPGTAWVVPWLVERVERWRPVAVVVDPGSPAGSLIAELTEAGLDVVEPTSREVGQACGQFHEAVTDSRTVRHRADPLLATALGGAKQRTIGDEAWAWARKGVTVDISPLVAATLALWGYTTQAAPMPALHFFGDDEDDPDDDEEDDDV